MPSATADGRDPGTVPGLVTVVMPAYNVAEFIAEAIESVLAQDYDRFELLIVDDGSTDGTAGVITRFSDPRIRVVTQANGGLTAARNTALAVARGEWVIFLDSDDTLAPGALSALMAGTAPGDGIRPVVVYGDFMRISEDGRPLGRRDLLARFRPISRPSGDVLAFMLQGFVQMIGTALVRRDVLQGMLPLKRGFEPMEDWVCFTLLASHGRFALVDRIVMNYRMRGTSLSMTAGLDIGRYEPALDFIFRHPYVRARFPADRLEQLRADREASILNFIAAQCVRSKAWRMALAAYASAVRRSRRKAVKGAVMMALAGIGM